MMRKVFSFFIAIFTLLSLPMRGVEEKNEVIVCDNGFEMFHWDLDFLRAAKQSVEISAVFLGGTIAQELFTIIEKKLEQIPELQVYILTTPILLEKPDLEFIKRLEAKFPKNFHLEHATSVSMIWPNVSGTDNHVKMFIVDEKYFSAGGTNLDDSQCSEGTWTPPRRHNKIPPHVSANLPAGTRDQDLVGRGPLAKEMREVFYKLYALWQHYNKTGFLEKDLEKFKGKIPFSPITQQAVVERFENFEKKYSLEQNQLRLILGGPHQKKCAITEEYIRLIKSAKHEIIIANLYFCPVDSIFNALLDAVNRGVKLTILTNGVSKVAPEYTKFFCWANRMNYVPMFYGKTYHFWDAWSVAEKKVKDTRIFEYHVQDILLHKKMMIVDQQYSIVGSYNLGMKSDMGDYELILTSNSKEIALALMEVHEKDLRYSKEVSPADARGWYFNPAIASLGEIQKRFHGLL